MNDNKEMKAANMIKRMKNIYSEFKEELLGCVTVTSNFSVGAEFPIPTFPDVLK